MTLDFNKLADEFFAATGLLAPGREMLEGGPDTAPDKDRGDERQREWQKFLATKRTTAINPFVLVENCRYGRFLVPPADQYVGRALQRYGEYSQVELDLLLQFVTPMTRVVIAGGNIGAFVVPFAQHAGEVVVFEPQRWVYQLLCANVVLNGLTNVRAYWAGLGAKKGAVRVPVLRPDIDNNFGALELEAVQNVPGDVVPILTLDQVPNVDVGLLTIDVEGMELQVLQGAEQTIKRCTPIVFFEADRAAKNPKVFAWMREQDYQLWWYRTPLYNPNNGWGIEENAWPGIAAHNVIGTPRSRNLTLTGFVPVLE